MWYLTIRQKETKWDRASVLRELTTIFIICSRQTVIIITLVVVVMS